MRNTIKNGLCSLVLGASSLLSNHAYAQEAQVATPEQISKIRVVQNKATTSINRDNAEDWSHQEDLMLDPKETVLIQAVPDQPGYCIVAINGYTQVYDPKFKDIKRTGANTKIDLGERILNLAEKDPAKKFYFPCDLKAEEPTAPTNPTTPNVPATKSKNPWKNGKLGVSLGYQVMGTTPDQETEYNGVMHGAMLKLTYTPSEKKLPYIGIALSAAGGWSGLEKDLTGTATDGPLKDRLVMRGTNEFSYQPLSLGGGIVIGGEVYANEKNTFGFGLEGISMLMHDWESHKFGESSAQFIDGVMVEGSAISNSSDRIDHNTYLSHQIGLRLRGGEFCVTPSIGFRNSLAAMSFNPMGGLTIGYCPKQNVKQE